MFCAVQCDLGRYHFFILLKNFLTTRQSVFFYHISRRACFVISIKEFGCVKWVKLHNYYFNITSPFFVSLILMNGNRNKYKIPQLRFLKLENVNHFPSHPPHIFSLLDQLKSCLTLVFHISHFTMDFGHENTNILQNQFSGLYKQ